MEIVIGLVVVGLLIGLYAVFKESNDLSPESNDLSPDKRKDVLDPLDNSPLEQDAERVTVRGVKEKTFVMRVNRRNASKLRSKGFGAFPRFHRNLQSSGQYDFYAEDALDDLLDVLYIIDLFEDWDESYSEFSIGDEVFEVDSFSETDPISIAELVADKSVEELAKDLEAPEPVVEAPEPVVEAPVVEAPDPVVENAPEPAYVAPEPAYVAPEPAPYVAPEPAPYVAPEPAYEAPSYDSGGGYDGGSSSSCGGGGDF